MDYREKVTDYLPDFTKALEDQLNDDFERWGDTWKQRPKEGQEFRIEQVFNNYFDKFRNANKPINWLAVCGNAMIAWIREQESKNTL